MVAVTGAVIVYDTADEVDPENDELVGVNFAVNECAPTASELVVNVAAPEPSTATGEPRAVVPSKNCTDPAVAGDSDAESVTAAP